MERSSPPIEYLGGNRYRVCNPGGGVCIDCDNPYRAATVAEALSRCYRKNLSSNILESTSD